MQKCRGPSDQGSTVLCKDRHADGWDRIASGNRPRESTRHFIGGKDRLFKKLMLC